MKRLFIFAFLSFAYLHANDPVKHAEMGSDLSTESTKKRPENAQSSVIKAEKMNIPPPIQIPQPSATTLEYFHPGILVFQDDKWVGSDHLLNLTENIGVYVTILKPDNDTLNISDANIKKDVEKIFSGAGIIPQTKSYKNQPPLPAFEIEILIYPVEKGYVCCCDGRLFESVTLSRFILDEGMAFEAITWEKRTLIVGPTNKFIDQLNANIKEIAEAFTERYIAYKKLSKRT
ncbi:MAG: hypothetical protein Q8K60_07295 [Parachlamydiaceae bacterium]|nr:hypothetical protein [Parachlamydiaceae bacterium]